MKWISFFRHSPLKSSLYCATENMITVVTVTRSIQTFSHFPLLIKCSCRVDCRRGQCCSFSWLIDWYCNLIYDNICKMFALFFIVVFSYRIFIVNGIKIHAFFCFGILKALLELNPWGFAQNINSVTDNWLPRSLEV